MHAFSMNNGGRANLKKEKNWVLIEALFWVLFSFTESYGQVKQ